MNNFLYIHNLFLIIGITLMLSGLGRERHPGRLLLAIFCIFLAVIAAFNGL